MLRKRRYREKKNKNIAKERINKYDRKKGRILYKDI